MLLAGSGTREVHHRGQIPRLADLSSLQGEACGGERVDHVGEAGQPTPRLGVEGLVVFRLAQHADDRGEFAEHGGAGGAVLVAWVVAALGAAIAAIHRRDV